MLIFILCLLPLHFIFPFSFEPYFVYFESFNFVKLNDFSHLFPPGHKQRFKFYLRSTLRLKRDICLRVAWVQSFPERHREIQEVCMFQSYFPSEAAVAKWKECWTCQPNLYIKVLVLKPNGSVCFAIMTSNSEFQSSQP